MNEFNGELENIVAYTGYYVDLSIKANRKAFMLAESYGLKIDSDFTGWTAQKEHDNGKAAIFIYDEEFAVAVQKAIEAIDRG